MHREHQSINPKSTSRPTVIVSLFSIRIEIDRDMPQCSVRVGCRKLYFAILLTLVPTTEGCFANHARSQNGGSKLGSDDGTLAQPKRLTVEELLSFERKGFLRLSGFLTTEEVSNLRAECGPSIQESESEALLHALNTNGEDQDPPFLQHFNPWRTNEDISRFCRSSRFASAAAQLLNADRVRLYQDCVFQKRPGDAPTDWHADLKMAPFDTNDFVTVWIALDEVPAFDDGGTGLHFVEGSHSDFALPYWHWKELTREDGPAMDLTERFANRIVEQDQVMHAGDCSWHHGWCLHSAPDLFDDETKERIAYTASYVADPVCLLTEGALGRQDGEDSISYEDWIDDFEPGDTIDHKLVPLVWPFK